MFEQSLVETVHRATARKPAAMMLSALVQLGVAVLAFAIPLIYYGGMPAIAEVAFLNLPSPPVAPAPRPVDRAPVVQRLEGGFSSLAPTPALAPPLALTTLAHAMAPPNDLGVVAGGDPGLDGFITEPIAAPPPPRPSVTAAVPVQVGGDVQQALCISCPDPPYPAAARLAHIEGTVVFNALIGADGQVQTLTAVSGNGLLAAAARRTVRAWRYHPLLLNGQPTPVQTTIAVTFSLGG